MANVIHSMEAGDRRVRLPELSLADLERQRIQECLERHDGNRTRAARELGIDRRTLLRKVKVFANQQAWSVSKDHDKN